MNHPAGGMVKHYVWATPFNSKVVHINLYHLDELILKWIKMVCIIQMS